MDPIVIIGSGLAGYTLARELRKLDRETPLVMLTADDGGFYSKPMLSNALAAGKSVGQLLNKPMDTMRQELAAEILARCDVRAIDTKTRTIRHSRGTSAYSRLVLALGADPIRLPLAGDGAPAVMSVNDLEDYARFRDAIAGRRRVAILGAGLIGCEFANDLASGGYEVDVIDIALQPLGRLLPPEAAAAVREALEKTGVRWHLGKTTGAVEKSSRGYRLVFSDGTHIETDAVLSAIGLKPRIELARAAGLAVNRGVVVDRFLRSSDPKVHALGDCAEVEGAVLPYVLPIMHAARALASTLAGRELPLRYPAMPVVVKTPALSTVVCPPPAGAAGAWRSEFGPDGIASRFFDPGDRVLGFALTGDAIGHKQRLLKEMQPA
jgi:rubredoxin---NAD+ reductase